jgi:hypothetical protein
MFYEVRALDRKAGKWVVYGRFADEDDAIMVADRLGSMVRIVRRSAV